MYFAIQHNMSRQHCVYKMSFIICQFYPYQKRQPFTYYSGYHDDVIKWKHFPRCWPFVRGIHINGWANNREAGDLRRHRTHYDVIVMPLCFTIQHNMSCKYFACKRACSLGATVGIIILVPFHPQGPNELHWLDFEMGTRIVVSAINKNLEMNVIKAIIDKALYFGNPQMIATIICVGEIKDDICYTSAGYQWR